MSKPEFTNHPTFAIWPPIYMPPAEQDTEYDADDSGDSPMLDESGHGHGMREEGSEFVEIAICRSPWIFTVGSRYTR